MKKAGNTEIEYGIISVLKENLSEAGKKKIFTEGDIYYMKRFGNEIGCEEKKDRFWVLIHKTGFGKNWLIAPLIPDGKKRKGREHCEWVRTSATGEPRIIALNQVRSVDPERFLAYKGRLELSELKEVYESYCGIFRKEADDIAV